MLFYTTGDLLQSNADALVNTVNCEGYMGKGIAYQFKLRFPENNVDYIKACKNGQLKPGKLHYFRECGKIIINFPTKNKWREKSKIEYIETGLDNLSLSIADLNPPESDIVLQYPDGFSNSISPALSISPRHLRSR